MIGNLRTFECDIDNIAKSLGLNSTLNYNYYSNSGGTNHIITANVGGIQYIVGMLMYYESEQTYKLRYMKHILVCFNDKIYKHFEFVILARISKLALVVYDLQNFCENLFNMKILSDKITTYWIEGSQMQQIENNPYSIDCLVLNLWNRNTYNCLDYVKPKIISFNTNATNMSHTRIFTTAQFYMFGTRAKTVPIGILEDIRLLSSRHITLRYFIFVIGDDNKLVSPKILIENPSVVVHDTVQMQIYNCRFSDILNF